MQPTRSSRPIPGRLSTARLAAALLLTAAALPAAASSPTLGPRPGAPAWVHDTGG